MRNDGCALIKCSECRKFEHIQDHFEEIMKYQQSRAYTNATLVQGIGKIYKIDYVCVYDESKVYIPESVQREVNPSFLLPYQEPTSTLDIEAIYGGYYINHVGHFIIENLARLWFAKEHPDLPIIWNSPAVKIPAYQQELFDIYGIQNKFIFVSEPTRVQKLHIPMPLARHKAYYSHEYFHTLGVYEGQKTVPGKKIFISRSEISGRGYINEKEIEQYARDRGYKIIIPEHISMQERLDEYSSAEEILMTYASSIFPAILIKNFSTKVRIFPRFIDPPCRAMVQFYENVHELRCNEEIVYKGSVHSGNLLYTSMENIEKCLENNQYLDETSYVDSSNIERSMRLQKESMPFEIDFIKSIRQAISLRNDHKVHDYINKSLNEYCNTYDTLENKQDISDNFNSLCNMLFEEIKDKSHIIDNLKIFLCRYDFEYGFSQKYFVNIVRNIPSALYAKEKIAILEDTLERVAANCYDVSDWFLDMCQIHLSELYILTNQDKKAYALYDSMCLRMQKFVCVYEEYIQYFVQQMFLKRHDFSKALESIEKGFALEKQWLQGYVFLANIYQAMGDIDASIAHITQAIALKPRNFRYISMHLQYLRSKHALDVVDSIIEQTAQTIPHWTDFHIQLSYNWNLKGDLDKAVYHAQQAVQVDPQNIQWKWHLSSLLCRQRNFIAAHELVEGVLQKNPTLAEAYTQLSHVYSAQGECDKALEYAIKARELTPENIWCIIHLTNLYRANGDYGTAQELMQQYILKAPYWGEPYVQCSYIYDAQGEVDSAISYARKAAEAEPYTLKYITHLCEMLRKNQKYEEVLEIMAAAMEMHPYWAEPYVHISHVYNAQGNIEKAIEYARKATEMAPYTLGYKAHLSRLLCNNQNFDLAAMLMTKCIEEFPYFAEAHAHMAAIAEAKAAQCAHEVMEKPYVSMRKKLWHGLHSCTWVAKLKPYIKRMLHR